MRRATRPTKILPPLTDEQVKAICSAAIQVWEEIAFDIFEATESDSIRRDEVIELVMDADRLWLMLQRKKADPELLAIVREYTPERSAQIESTLRQHCFKFAWYGR